jgi:Fur family zinc uptake transcriptional regulator
MNSTTQENLLAQAEQLCRQRNVRLTPQRLEVLRLMSQQPGAISAYELLDLLRIAEPQAKPTTVYRALDFLMDQGFIHRVESANSYILCHHFGQPMHTSALFICDRCSQVTERTTEDVEKTLQKLAKESGFSLHHSLAEAHGLCTGCVEAEACRSKHDCGEHAHSIAIKRNRLG